MSYTNPSLCSRSTPPHNPSLSNHGFASGMKTLAFGPPHPHKSLSFPTKTSPSNPPRPSCLRPRSPFLLPLPISSFPRASCSSHTPQKDSNRDDEKSLLRSCAETLAVLLIGSFFFVGRFGCRPALALADAQKSGTAAHLEEEVEGTQNAEGDEEEMSVRILESNPRDVEALKVVLYGKMRKGKTREAVDYVERLIVVEPDEVEWRLLQALCCELMGQLSKAKRLFKDILEEKPLLLRALHGLALVMHKNHEGPAVFEMLDEALQLARREQRVTEERNIRILIAQMHVVKGDFDGGLKELKTLINENNGDLEGGLKKFQQLTKENPRDFRPYLCQGIIYSLLDRKEEAEEQFEIYRSLVPGEFPQRGFLDDVILAAKTNSQEQLEKDFKSDFSYKK